MCIDCYRYIFLNIKLKFIATHASGFATCGSISMCLGCFCYFLFLVKMYQDYLDSLGKSEADELSTLLSLNFHFTLSLLWLMSSLMNLPTLLTWYQNLHHGLPIPADPSLIHAIILCSSLSILWQNNGKPKVEKNYFSLMAIILLTIMLI